MDYYNLGAVEWWQSQCYYHALAELGREALVLCYPATPYVCLGLHDDLEQEINFAYCIEHGLPLLRRETGGGVVYLDRRQVFFQLVFNRNSGIVPLNRTRFYVRFLQPAISVCHKLGINVTLRDPADIVCEGRKCSGNASGDIGQGVAYVGNLLIDFDCRTMTDLLKLPSPEFRRVLFKAMQANLFTLSERIFCSGSFPDELSLQLEQEFERYFTLNPCKVDQELKDMAAMVYRRNTSADWLNLPGKKRKYRRVKISENVYLMEYRLKNGDDLAVLVKQGIVDQVNALSSAAVNGNDYRRYLGEKWHDDFLAEELY